MTALPLTSAQHDVWVAQQLDPASPLFNCALYLELPSADRVDDAVRRVVAETEALRVRFTPDGTQHVDDSITGEVHEITCTESEARAWMDADLARATSIVDDELFTHVLFGAYVGVAMWAGLLARSAPVHAVLLPAA